jgi:hypothetical protein
MRLEDHRVLRSALFEKAYRLKKLSKPHKIWPRKENDRGIPQPEPTHNTHEKPT